MNSLRIRRTGPWLALALLSAMTLAACNLAVGPPGETREPGGGGGSVGGSGNPDDPIVAPVVPPGPVQPGDGALVVEPEPGIVDARPHAWDHITVAPDGKTVTIYYWGGVEDCYGLAGVDVQRDSDGLLKLTVMEGWRGDLAPDTACIEIALLKSVTITLDQPMLAPAE
jgi:hypothetical protein